MDRAYVVGLYVLCFFSNGVDVVVQYFFVQAATRPNPRTAVNANSRSWAGYQAWMYVLGVFVGIVNGAAWAVYFKAFVDPNYYRRSLRQRLFLYFNLFILGPLAVMTFLAPFVVPKGVALPIAQKIAWNHGCDRYPVNVVLSSRGYYDSVNFPTTARYFRGDSPIYTYDIYRSSTSEWNFNLRTLDANDLDPFAAEYPSISNATYNFNDLTVSGVCTSPSSNTTATCLTGSFNPGHYVSFSLNDLITNTTSNIRAVDKEWTFKKDAPSVLFRDDNSVEVLRTDVTKYRDCRQLKVCVAEDVGPDVIFPVGLLLIYQSDYAITCTQPEPDN